MTTRLDNPDADVQSDGNGGQAGITSLDNERWVLLLTAPDAVFEDAPPLFADRGTIPLLVNTIRIPLELLVAHHRPVDGPDQWVAIGLLCGVSPKPDGNVGFYRYEHFNVPVEIGPPASISEVDQEIALARWPLSTVDEAMQQAGKQWSSAARAIEFAQYLAWAFTGTALLRRSSGRALREHAPAHHLFHRQVKYWLTEFLADRGHESMPFQMDTDGLLRDGTARSRYTLLGSYVQPATSIVSPFRCAIDYTVQTDPTSGVEIRQGLLESWAHVAGGSYDAAVRVVVLRSDTPHELHSYLSLRHISTRNFLERLKESSVFLALLGPGEKEDGA
jgi:hypothetical protein